MFPMLRRKVLADSLGNGCFQKENWENLGRLGVGDFLCAQFVFAFVHKN
jgi:hypothetical protein